MIEPMKKVTLLVSEKERARFVTKLRKLGVVHVKHASAPEAHEITHIEDRISRIEKMLDILRPFPGDAGAGQDAECREKDVMEDVALVEEIKRDIDEHNQRLNGLRAQLEWFAGWGEFDPSDLEFLKERGIALGLYSGGCKDLASIPEDVRYSVISRDKGRVNIAAIVPEGTEDMPFDEVGSPAESSPDRIREETGRIETTLAGKEEELREKAKKKADYVRCLEKLRKERENLTVRFGMKGEGRFAYLQGYCPQKLMGDLAAMAKKENAGYLSEKPDDPDDTPTLITNPKWIRIIDPVFGFMNTVPGYGEFDISFVFMCFFSVFFAMLIGDAGYGVLFLAATFLARKKMKNAPREPFFLMYLLSAATIIWGTLTGTWFGSEKIAQLPLVKAVTISGIGSFAGDNQNFIIYICFVIGAVQLTIAHLMRAARMMNSPKAISQLGWISIVWGMFFAAGKLVINRPFPSFAGWMLIGGIAAVLFFSNAEKGWLKGALSTLADLPLSVISSFSDVVSYLRLFAVGYASVVLASTFNEMAIGAGAGSLIGGLAAALILVAGHTLNIILGMMAVVVHGIRLNMLEFSGHLGMQWSGERYDPFVE